MIEHAPAAARRVRELQLERTYDPAELKKHGLYADTLRRAMKWKYIERVDRGVYRRRLDEETMMTKVTDWEDFESAVEFAAQALSGVRDKGGRPTLLHCIEVAMQFDGNPRLATIAMLHDVLEDAPPIDEARIAGLFGEDVARVVALLTHDKHETYEHYLQRVCTDRDAITVKIADVTNNMGRLERLIDHTATTDDDLVRLYRKYVGALRVLFPAQERFAHQSILKTVEDLA